MLLNMYFCIVFVFTSGVKIKILLCLIAYKLSLNFVLPKSVVKTEKFLIYFPSCS